MERTPEREEVITMLLLMGKTQDYIQAAMGAGAGTISDLYQRIKLAKIIEKTINEMEGK